MKQNENAGIYMENEDMENNATQKIALHAPNLINICIDSNEGGTMAGRLYHCYKESV